MKKRILSILLLCCMVLTLLPTAAFAAGEIDEQFTLAPSGVYYFDLSGVSIPGTANGSLPDKTMQPLRSMQSRKNIPTACSWRTMP